MIHYEIVGDGPGEPILVVPGGGVRDPAYLGDVGTWGLARPLAVVHMRGTPMSPGQPEPWWNQRADLDAVCSAIGLDDVDLLAHSAGSWVALAYAALGPRVRSLGLVTPPSAELTGSPSDAVELANARIDEPWIAAALAAPAPDLGDEAGFREHQRVTAPLGYATWTEVAEEHSRTGSIDFEAFRAFFGAPPPPDLINAVRALCIPVHVMGGAADLLTGVKPVRDLAGLFARGSVELIEGSGHYPWIDRPEAFAAALQEWERVGGRT